MLFGLLIVLVVISSLKGSHKYPSAIGIDYCGGTYWGANVTMFLICIAFIKMVVVQLNKKDAL